MLADTTDERKCPFPAQRLRWRAAVLIYMTYVFPLITTFLRFLRFSFWLLCIRGLLLRPTPFLCLSTKRRSAQHTLRQWQQCTKSRARKPTWSTAPLSPPPPTAFLSHFGITDFYRKNESKTELLLAVGAQKFPLWGRGGGGFSPTVGHGGVGTVRKCSGLRGRLGTQPKHCIPCPYSNHKGVMVGASSCWALTANR